MPYLNYTPHHRTAVASITAGKNNYIEASNLKYARASNLIILV